MRAGGGGPVDSSNELASNSTTSYTYDNNGNTTSKTDSTGTTNYTWDFENRLTQVTLPGTGGTVTFKYDPFGRRIYKSSSSGTTVFAFDGDNVIETTNAAGAIISKYAQGQNIDEPLAESTAGATSFYEQDGLDSVTSLTNSAGAVAQTYTYDSFGKLANSSGTLTNPFQYTGRELDSETGLYYYRARYYDPSTGRFLNEDPISFGGGVNFYRYVANSSTAFTDPYGLAPVNQQDMTALNALFPGSRRAGPDGLVVPMPCDQVRRILEQNGYYSGDNWSSPLVIPGLNGIPSVGSNPFLFWDPIAHSGGWEFRKPDGMHFRMKYPNKPCDKTCTLDQAHQDVYNPMYDPWGHFWHEVLPPVGVWWYRHVPPIGPL